MLRPNYIKATNGAGLTAIRVGLGATDFSEKGKTTEF